MINIYHRWLICLRPEISFVVFLMLKITPPVDLLTVFILLRKILKTFRDVYKNMF